MKRFNMTKRAIEGILVINFLVCGGTSPKQGISLKAEDGARWRRVVWTAFGFLIKVKILLLEFLLYSFDFV